MTITSVSKHIIEINEKNNWEEIVIEFLKNLKTDYDNFISNYNSNLELFKNKKFEKSIILSPENLYVKSPMTIIDGKWGIGKTFFIEKIAYVMNDKEEVRKKYFENYININLWCFSDPKYSPMDLIIELFNKLSEIIFSKDEQLGIQIIELGKKIAKSICIPFIKNTFNIDIEELFKKTKKDEETIQEINEILNSKLSPTIVILDNIERLGPLSIQVFKGIHKLLQLKNMVFVLPINITQLEFSINGSYETINKDTEIFIEKYINIDYYSFEQNTISFLKDKLLSYLNLDSIILLNNILNESIKGRLLSIRNIEHVLDNHWSEIIENGFKKNDFTGMNKLRKYWPFVNKDLIISKFNYEFETIDNFVTEYKNKIDLVKNDLNKIDNWEMEKLQIFYTTNHNSSEESLSFKINKNFSNWEKYPTYFLINFSSLEVFESTIFSLKEKTTNTITSLHKEEDTLNVSSSAKRKEIEKAKSRIDTLNKEKEELKIDVETSNIRSQKQIEINELMYTITELEKIIEVEENSINSIKNEISVSNKILEKLISLEVNFSELITFIKKTNSALNKNQNFILEQMFEVKENNNIIVFDRNRALEKIIEFILN